MSLLIKAIYIRMINSKKVVWKHETDENKPLHVPFSYFLQAEKFGLKYGTRRYMNSWLGGI